MILLIGLRQLGRGQAMAERAIVVVTTEGLYILPPLLFLSGHDPALDATPFLVLGEHVFISFHDMVFASVPHLAISVRASLDAESQTIGVRTADLHIRDVYGRDIYLCASTEDQRQRLLDCICLQYVDLCYSSWSPIFLSYVLSRVVLYVQV